MPPARHPYFTTLTFGCNERETAVADFLTTIPFRPERQVSVQFLADEPAARADRLLLFVSSW